jgi:transcriptional regulator with XRE-family HTH domain
MKTMLKTDARVLRRRGYSFHQLSIRLGVSKSTASLWTRDVEMSPFGIERLALHRKRSMDIGHSILHQKKLDRLTHADKEAETRLKEIDMENKDVLVALAMMYWCEGAKNNTYIKFTNSNPKLANAFIIMLNKVFRINKTKIRVTVHLHNYHNTTQILEFWSATLRIPLSQFTKPFRKESEHTFKKEDYKGCVCIAYGSSHIARVLLSFAKKYINLYI